MEVSTTDLLSALHSLNYYRISLSTVSRIRVGMHSYMQGWPGPYLVFWAGKSPNIWSYVAHIYGSGQAYIYAHS